MIFREDRRRHGRIARVAHQMGVRDVSGSTALKGVTSLRVYRDFGVTQETAWLLLPRIREAYAAHAASVMDGAVEVDDTYVGGTRRNMHAFGRRRMTGHGPVGKAAVAGFRARSSGAVNVEVVSRTDKSTLQEFTLSRRARPSQRTITARARACRPGSAKALGTASANTRGAWPTRKAWRASGRCSIAPTRPVDSTCFGTR